MTPPARLSPAGTGALLGPRCGPPRARRHHSPCGQVRRRRSRPEPVAAAAARSPETAGLGPPGDGRTGAGASSERCASIPGFPQDGLACLRVMSARPAWPTCKPPSRLSAGTGMDNRTRRGSPRRNRRRGIRRFAPNAPILVGPGRAFRAPCPFGNRRFPHARPSASRGEGVSPPFLRLRLRAGRVIPLPFAPTDNLCRGSPSCPRREAGFGERAASRSSLQTPPRLFGTRPETGLHHERGQKCRT